MKVKYKKAGRDVQVMPNKINSGSAARQVNDVQSGIKYNPFKGKKKTLF